MSCNRGCGEKTPCCPQPGCPPDKCRPGCNKAAPVTEDRIPSPVFTCPEPRCPLPPECQSPKPEPLQEEETVPEEEAEAPEDIPDSPEKLSQPPEEVPECPPDADPEADRPSGYTELISGEESWQEYGIKIVCTYPPVPGSSDIRVGQPIYLMVCVEAQACIKLNPNSLSCWCWTSLKTACNKCGVWKEVYLPYSPCDTEYGQNIHRFVYRGFITPTATENYRMTFNLKWLEKNLMLWVDDFKKDNEIGVKCGDTSNC